MANKVLDRGAIATTIKEKKLEPILRWAGGKRKHKWLFEAITKVFNPHKHRLIEPFAGGLAIALGVDPKWALLNDKNHYLIDLYSRIKTGFEIDPNLKNYTSKESYYRLRDRFNALLSMPQYAEVQTEIIELFYYLNRTGFNGLCRFNQSGGYNNAYGDLAKPKLAHDFEAYRAKFENWIFTSMDFELIEPFSNDIIVADAPYDVLEGKDDHDYVAGGFDWVDQVRLADWLASLKRPVFSCNLATDRVVDLYTTKGFDIQYVNAPRAIACNGDRAKVREILATKNLGL
jgi:DNA adenine methylase